MGDVDRNLEVIREKIRHRRRQVLFCSLYFLIGAAVLIYAILASTFLHGYPFPAWTRNVLLLISSLTLIYSISKMRFSEGLLRDSGAKNPTSSGETAEEKILSVPLYCIQEPAHFFEPYRVESVERMAAGVLLMLVGIPAVMILLFTLLKSGKFQIPGFLGILIFALVPFASVYGIVKEVAFHRRIGEPLNFLISSSRAIFLNSLLEELKTPEFPLSSTRVVYLGRKLQKRIFGRGRNRIYGLYLLENTLTQARFQLLLSRDLTGGFEELLRQNSVAYQSTNQSD